MNYRAFHDKSNDTGGGSISNIYGALKPKRGLIIAEWLKMVVATPERYLKGIKRWYQGPVTGLLAILLEEFLHIILLTGGRRDEGL
jgi:hypothetical protein